MFQLESGVYEKSLVRRDAYRDSHDEHQNTFAKTVRNSEVTTSRVRR